jgi:spectinomycin phosphotransferase
LPDDLEERELIESLRQGWGLNLVSTEYAAVGGGSYHWKATDDAGGRHWLTVDDLDHKGYPGDTRDSAFDGLRAAFETALALRTSGLDFVVAPVPTPKGETVRRVGTHHTAAVFPFIEGRAGRFGERLAAGERAQLVDMLIRLHQAAPAAARLARPESLQVPGRRDLESALDGLDQKWVGGPFSEPARALLAGRSENVRGLLETFDHLAGQVVAARAEPVVSHGEPHPANVIDANGRLLLIDWDTVGLAPPERDLWMVDGGEGDELRQYSDATGRPIDGAAIRLYRLRWQLDDIAIRVGRFRSAHRRTADTEKAWLDLGRLVESGGP